MSISLSPTPQPPVQVVYLAIIGTLAMAEDQLIDEILILFTAGHETTSNALTFTCELLARHPQVQENILSEVKKTLP